MKIEIKSMKIDRFISENWKYMTKIHKSQIPYTKIKILPHKTGFIADFRAVVHITIDACIQET